MKGTTNAKPFGRSCVITMDASLFDWQPYVVPEGSTYDPNILSLCNDMGRYALSRGVSYFPSMISIPALQGWERKCLRNFIHLACDECLNDIRVLSPLNEHFLMQVMSTRFGNQMHWAYHSIQSCRIWYAGYGGMVQSLDQDMPDPIKLKTIVDWITHNAEISWCLGLCKEALPFDRKKHGEDGVIPGFAEIILQSANDGRQARKQAL